MTKIQRLEEKAREIRRRTVACIGRFGMGHIGGCLSIADVLAVLYFDRMNVDPADPKKEDRDRLVLSKGHAGPALYSALSLRGFFPEETLMTLNAPDTLLPSHCDMRRTPGVDMTAGSLGQGLSAAVGMALGARLAGLEIGVYAILGEGDCQEGATWEAAMYAAHKGLSRLTVFVDLNGLQIDGTVDAVNSLGDVGAKWAGFGWNVVGVKDGNDVGQLLAAMDAANFDTDKPTVFLLRTVKGKGVSFMEGRIEFHHAAISPEQARAAAAELGGGEADA